MGSWKWIGTSGHFIDAARCRFHLHTHIGKYCISSVGDYWPRLAKEAQEIGCDRKFETMVFDLESESRWTEIDAEGYNDSEAAENGHLEMCRKWEGGR